MKLLSIDPAEHTGFAIFDEEKLIKAEITHLTFSKEGEAVWEAYQKGSALIELYKPDYIAMEDYFFSGRKCMGANINLYIRAGFLLAAHQNNIPLTLIGHSVWYRFIYGRSRPSKDDKKRYKTHATKITVREALEKKYSITFPEWCYQDRIKVALKYDLIDAVGIGIYWLVSEKSITGIHSIIEWDPSPVWELMSVAQLKEKCDKLNLPKTGTKKVLIDRLSQIILA